MSTSARKNPQAFAVWLTGLPGSGKSTITRELVLQLQEHEIDSAVLESDVLRRVLTPTPTYSEEERDTFYGALLHMGRLLVNHGVPVIFDATANRRRYRDAAREHISRFLEVYVATPIELCARRDPKGLYRQASDGDPSPQSRTLPGVGAEYEPPMHADLVIDTKTTDANTAAAGIVTRLQERGWID
ncbi:MAG: adenylyl-sulfate kinase [Phycisphaeraceae bacterium]